MSENTIDYFLWVTAKDCKDRCDAYWKEYYRYRKYNNVLSIPLLVASSAAGLSSVAQVNDYGTDKKFLNWIITIFGVSSTVLSAMQRYFRFGEKSIACKNMAKSFARISRKIVVNMQIYSCDSNDWDDDKLKDFNISIQNEIDTITNEIEDIPADILKRKDIFRPHTKLEDIKAKVIMEHTPPSSPVKYKRNYSLSDNDSSVKGSKEYV